MLTQVLPNLEKYNIVLASNSPRRKELLTRLGLKFKVRTLLGLNESYPDTLAGADIAEYVAAGKAKAYLSTMGDNDLLIAADTIVCVDGRVLGKPKDNDESKKMLHLLSNRLHQVITGVAVLTKDRLETFSVTSHVKFSRLTDREIDYYVDNYLPFDKAGAYGVQEWIGLVAVEEIRGSYFNVMGLPVQRLYSCLKMF